LGWLQFVGVNVYGSSGKTASSQGKGMTREGDFE